MDVPYQLRISGIEIILWRDGNERSVCYKSAKINELKAMGNAEVELIVTSGKGYRPDLRGIRLPHAWSIVDEPDLANWIEQKIG